MTYAAGHHQNDTADLFYESLDRLLSSSECSTSTTSDTEQEPPQHHHHKPDDGIYNYALALNNNYDLWISHPSSVSERRSSLLRHLGLAAPSPPRDNGDSSRSPSSDQLTGLRQGSAGGMPRSSSDGAADPQNSVGDGVDDDDEKPCGSCSLSRSSCRCCRSCSSSSSILSIRSAVPEAGKYVNSRNRRGGSVGGGGGNGGSPWKPPSGRNGKSVDFGQNGSMVPENVAGEVVAVAAEAVASGDYNEVNEEACTIRDLDNGKEFVVKEFREDGMWNKFREVGTGRQLTMEEFEMTVGHSPIVQELMRRQNVEESHGKDNVDSIGNEGGKGNNGSKLKKRGNWLRALKSAMGTHKERRSSDERDTSSEKGGRRSSSATDDSQDNASFHGPERVKVRQYGKPCKEVTALYKSQEIQAHNGSIWSIKFSLDGKYLASAGEDCVIHVWQVVESERKGELLMEKHEDGNMNMLFVVNGSSLEPNLLSPLMDKSPLLDNHHPERKRKGRTSITRKSLSLDQLVIPDTVFALTEKPICSFQGHLHDVLDLSWSKSQHLLSSSMDKTVRLWHLSSNSCLKVFSHSDFVTCIQFNPVDDNYFISGSLDAKVRIWSIPDRQVVDWTDMHEMVTAACYTPDGQSALVGSYKGSCHLYNTSENKLQQKSQINLQNKKKKSHLKKITGFQFAPGSSSEVLITSADSRIRVVDGVDLVHKFKGFRNSSSQISASLTANGKYIVSASEDSHVYIWKNEADCRPNRSKGVTITGAYEHFHCKDVSVAIPWPGMGDAWDMHDTLSGEQTEIDNNVDEALSANHPPTPVEENFGSEGSRSTSVYSNSPRQATIAGATNSYFFDRISATWPEEKLVVAATKNRSPRISGDYSNTGSQNMSAWGMVIVTAGLRGEIRTFQNFGLPLRI
ncbi:WD repeat-containing protein 44 [Arachis ipaensis]|uniref:WD repeat-containing protein 44 n=1 Tax=Arachis ipaensis TaxID=130454 RepID=UPI0007AFD56F|nr:WD repeat-containing protein 44 [Arachis ipaensis]